MLFMVISKTRQDLTKEEFTKLSELAKRFYGHIPDGVILHHDWAALDGSCTFALIEAEAIENILEIQKPFEGYVDIETKEVREVLGWGK